MKQGGKMNILEFLKNGSGIHIKEKNKGSFTRWCGGNVTEKCIRRGKASSNPKIRKKATFADNTRHFKHKSGGVVKALMGWLANLSYKLGLGSKGDWRRMKSDLVNLGILLDNSENPNQQIGAPNILPGLRTNVSIMEKEAPTLFRMIAENPKGMKELSGGWTFGTGSWNNKTYWTTLGDKLRDFFKTGNKNVLKELEDWAKNNRNVFVSKKLTVVEPKGYISGTSKEKPMDYISREVLAKPMSDRQWDVVDDSEWGTYLDRIIQHKKGGKAFVNGTFKDGGVIKAANARKWKHLQGGTIGSKINNWFKSDLGKVVTNGVSLLYTGLQENANLVKLNDLLQEWKKSYLKSIQPEDFSTLVNQEEALIKQSNPDYNSSPLVKLHKLYLLLTQALNRAREKAGMDADQYIQLYMLAQQNNSSSGDIFSGMLKTFLG